MSREDNACLPGCRERSADIGYHVVSGCRSCYGNSCLRLTGKRIDGRACRGDVPASNFLWNLEY